MWKDDVSCDSSFSTIDESLYGSLYESMLSLRRRPGAKTRPRSFRAVGPAPACLAPTAENRTTAKAEYSRPEPVVGSLEELLWRVESHYNHQRPSGDGYYCSRHKWALVKDLGELRAGPRNIPPVRPRHARLNSSFLHRYALDGCARRNGRLLLTELAGELELLLRLPGNRPFHQRHDLARISAMSREKLWQAVVLPQRADSAPGGVVDCGPYTRLGGALAASRLYRPAGGFPRPALSSTSLLSRTQYTARGWTNLRWS